MSPLVLLVAAVVGYLLGGIPTGLLVARAYRVDLTAVGSKRTGATNVLRAVGPVPAALVFIGDFLKAALAAWLMRVLFDNAWVEVIAATAAVVGHGFSPYIGFKGGRGVTPGLGGLAVISWWIFLIALGTGLLVILLTRFVSLGSMLGTLVAALVIAYMVAVVGWPLADATFAVAVAGFILFSHHDNIARLVSGRERKLGESVKT